jgi:ribosome-associated toxin RatA of RatAB toxin-antitoxin module
MTGVAGYSASKTVAVDASAQACFDALADLDSMPEWQSSLKEINVEERDAEGRGTVVEYALDAKVRTVRYRLRLTYDEPSRIGSEYLDGDFKNLEAEWRFEPAAYDKTNVTLDIVLDPGRFVPGPVRKIVQDVVLNRSLNDLRKRVETA